MERYFNIGGPCSAGDHYMLPAMARLPQVVSLISKKQYFVVHAQRQCGKTTAFLSLANEMNAKGEAVALSRMADALARWCVEEIHGERYGETITAADMCEAKEKIVREGKTLHVFFC